VVDAGEQFGLGVAEGGEFGGSARLMPASDSCRIQVMRREISWVLTGSGGGAW
jgi:hypothetical protein